MENTNSTTPVSGTSQTTTTGTTAANWERELIEKMLSSNLKEQRLKRRWSILFKFIWIAIFLLIMAGIGSINMDSIETFPSEPHAALIRIPGEIAAESRASAETVNKALNKAFQQKSTVGIILNINSPGGSPVQAGQIYDEIVRLRGKYPDKPIHVVVDEICASGGYYIAAAANNIYVDKASLVGSIGVMMSSFGFTGLIEKIGVERRLTVSGKNKGFLDPFSPQDPGQKEFVQNLIDEIHQQFISVVRAGRGDRLHETEETFSGLVWTGSKAVQLGLADGFGSVDSVARDVLKTTTIVDYTEEENLSDRILKRLGASIGESATRYGASRAVPEIR